MRKRYLLALCLVLMLISFTQTYAASSPYTVDELHLTVQVPDHLKIVTRNSGIDALISDYYLDISEDGYREDMINRNVYLTLYSVDPTYYFEFTMTDDELTGRVYDYKEMSDSELNEAIELVKNSDRYKNVKLLEGPVIYKNNVTTYFTESMEQSYEGSPVYSTNYMTISNGQYINIVCYSFDENMMNLLKSEAKSIVDNTQYENIPKPVTEKDVKVSNDYFMDWLKIILQGIGLVFIIGAVYRWIKKSRNKNKYES